jgi:hypothetical protein
MAARPRPGRYGAVEGRRSSSCDSAAPIAIGTSAERAMLAAVPPTIEPTRAHQRGGQSASAKPLAMPPTMTSVFLSLLFIVIVALVEL